jgi:hypothetical protein
LEGGRNRRQPRAGGVRRAYHASHPRPRSAADGRIQFHGSQHSYSGAHPKQSTTRQSDSNANSVHRLSLWEDDRGDGGLVWRAFARVWHFFEPRFEDPERELEYQKLSWYSNKPVAIYASLYLYLNWVLYLILNHSDTLYEKYIYYGGLSMFTLPIPFLIAFNVPRR